jgi:type I restriction enzyme M protein
MVGYNLKNSDTRRCGMATTLKSKKKARAVKEPAVEYEVGEQFLPVKDEAAVLDVIFRDPDVKHGLTVFAAHEKSALDLWKRGEKFYLHCLIRQKKVIAKPEEVVRQLCIKRLFDLGYTADQMSLEVPVKMGSTVHSKAADIVIYREPTMRLTSYIVVELKRPLRKDGIDQLESYMNATGVPVGG